MLNEDQRQAASMVPGISSNIGTAALGALAALIALFTYFSQNYKLDALFYTAAALSLGCFAANLGFGGLGTRHLVEKVADSSWEKSDQIWPYRIQTGLALAGIVFFAAMTVVGVKSPKQTDATAHNIQRLEERVAVLENKATSVSSGISWTHQVDRIEDDDRAHK